MPVRQCLALWHNINILLAQEISEVSNGVFRVANKLALGLRAMVFLAIDVGQNGGNLAIYILSARALSKVSRR